MEQIAENVPEEWEAMSQAEHAAYLRGYREAAPGGVQPLAPSRSPLVAGGQGRTSAATRDSVAAFVLLIVCGAFIAIGLWAGALLFAQPWAASAVALVGLPVAFLLGRRTA